MTAVTDTHVAALRALLRCDIDSYERLGADDAGEGYDYLFVGAFLEAVERRFGRDRSNADIVRFVAAVRLRNSPGEVDPGAAERLIRAALGETSAIADMADQVKASTQVPLLYELIADEQLDDNGLDEFLTRAKARAERIPG